MSDIRVEFVPSFKGEAVVLLAMDVGGLAVFTAAVAQAIQTQQGSIEMVHAGVTHIFSLGHDTAEVDIQENQIAWRFPPSKLIEILEKLEAMKKSPVPCHHYVDISIPAETLVLSRDEYVQVVHAQL